MPRVPLTMPKMSMTMEFGTIVEWLVDEGAEVHQGDAVLVVTTDKVDMDVEAMTDGVLVQKLATDGDEVPVGEPIGYIESETDDLLGDLFAPPAATPGTYSIRKNTRPCTRISRHSHSGRGTFTPA